ncbi:FkbM family methyltransferase [Dyella sp. 20L07]|uniref:FkbM family methyltransferase n=1 Tax=Dyella sp. 20L07 TaxID=3384240 RepID=UPI003D2E1015
MVAQLRTVFRVKDALQRIAVSNIYLYVFSRWVVGRLPFMLPHDADFHGLSKLANDRDLLLDVGANDGLSARSMHHLRPQKPIFSIEPNPTHERSLVALRAKGWHFDFRMVGAGQGATSFTLFTPVYRGFALTNYASMNPDAVRANLEKHMNIDGLSRHVQLIENVVPVIPLDELKLVVDVVKIDVEGLEDLVVAGLRETIDRCRPTFMVEYNPLSYPNLSEFFASRNYRVCRYLKQSGAFVDFDGGPVLNVFFIPSERMLEVGR